MKKNIRFSGAGGQGVILASVLLARAYGLGEGLNISQTQSYGPEARGGACKAELVVSDIDIDYMKVNKADVFVAFNQAGFEKYISDVKEGGAILINSTLIDSVNKDYYSVPATEIAEKLGNRKSVNIVMLGALTRLLDDVSKISVLNELKENFGNDLIDVNEEAFALGYEYMDEQISGPPKETSDILNVLVCITKQKTCDRLIERGKKLVDLSGGELSIIHVAHANKKESGADEDKEVMDYLYKKAMEYGTNISVLRSENPVDTLVNFILNNSIKYVIIGKSNDLAKENVIRDELSDKVADNAIIEVVS